MIEFPPDATVEDIEAALADLSEADAAECLYDWPSWARAEQRMPEGDWRTWLILSGRGWGKTRTAAETVREWSRDPRAVIALVGPTSADVRDVMIEGESGILNVFPPDERPMYQPSKRRVVFRTGAVAYTYSAEEPERLRGPQHSHASVDELATFPFMKELWDNLQFGLRLGDDPRIIVTTTPKPSKFLRDLVADPHTRLTRGRTFDNVFLPEATLREFERVYGGTRIGRQELEGELLDEAEGALWTRSRIEENRVRAVPELTRIVVAIDPATTSGPEADETGIVVAGVGVDGYGYVLADRSCRVAPDVWAARAVHAYQEFDADRIIAETNNGGDLVLSVISTVQRSLPYAKVHASRGKVARAEPVAALFEQNKIKLAGGFPALEDEMVNFVPGALRSSPNRVDALVWAISYLMIKAQPVGRALLV